MVDKKTDLTTRKRIGAVVDIQIWETFGQLSDKTRIPKSKLLDEALEDLFKKYDFPSE